MSEYNPGFAFYDSYYKAIEKLPLEQQMEVCYAIVKYGITYEMVDPAEMPIGYSLTVANKEHIKNSVDRWLQNQARASYETDEKVSRDKRIAELIAEGLNSIEIAEKISEEYGECKDSAIRKTEPWKQRNDKDFAVKWLGKNVKIGTENVKVGTDACPKNVNAACSKNVNDVKNGTEKCSKNVNSDVPERENSQNWNF